MFFDLDDDQLALQATVRELAAGHFPVEVARRWAEPGGAGVDRAAWSALAELGTFTLGLPEDRGGLDLPTVDSVLVYQALGGALVPGPLVAATLAADLDEAVGTGERLAAVAVRPRPGTPWLVEHLTDADVLYVLDPAGVVAFDPATVPATQLPAPLDPTTSLSLVDTGGLPAGEPVGDARLAAHWLALGSLLTSALLAGNAVRTVELATTYAKQREQFGRAIGTFQAVKHMIADSFARAEVARAAVDAAGVLFDDADLDDADLDDPGQAADGSPGPATRRAIAVARVLAAEAAVTNAKSTLQVHGGMGFTWEVDVHLYLKRAWLLETAYTTPDDAAEAVADLLQRA